MSEVNISSKNQSGGITAQNVGSSDSPKEPDSKPSTPMNLIVIVGVVASVVAGVIAVLVYFGIKYE